MTFVHGLPNGPFSARIKPFQFGSVATYGWLFICFLERCTQQVHLILPCCGKSLAAEKQHVEVNAQVQRPRQLRQHRSNTRHP